jgi:hypothetical protein
MLRSEQNTTGKKQSTFKTKDGGTTTATHIAAILIIHTNLRLPDMSNMLLPEAMG